jgi:hypothetical protein
MAEKVQIELTVEQAQAINAWIKNNSAIVQNQEALRKLGEASEAASNKSKSGFEGAVTAIYGFTKGVAGGLLSMNTLNQAVDLFKQRLEQIDRLNRNAFDYQVDKGTAQRKALLALGKDGDITPQQMVQRVENESRIDPARTYQMLDAAVSAAGDLGATRGLETALAAGNFAPHLANDELTSMTTGALELQKGSPEYGPAQSIAKLLELLEISRVESPDKFGKNVLPGLGQARAYGGMKDDIGFVNAFFSSLQQRMGDGEGATSTTAGLTLLKQLTVEGRKAGLFGEGTSIEDQLNAVQGDSKEAIAIRKKLLGPLEAGYVADRAAQKAGRASDPKLRGEAQAYIALSEMLQAGSQTDQTMRRFAAKGGGSPEETLRRAEALQQELDSVPGQQAGRSARAYDRSQAGIRGDLGRAMEGTQEKFYDVLREVGVNELELGTHYAWRGVGRMFGGNRKPDEVLTDQIDTLEDWRGTLAFSAKERAKWRGGDDQQVKEDTLSARKLDELIAELRAQREDYQRQHAEEMEALRTPVEIKLPANVAPAAAPAGMLNDGAGGRF